MPNREHLSAVGLELLIVVLGLVGLLLIVGLGMAWRHHQRRQNQLDKRRNSSKKSRPHASLWEEAGRRYQEPQEPPASEPPDRPDYPDRE